MLSQSALESALPLAEVLDNNNFVLEPIAGTPLAALVNATRSSDNFNEMNGAVIVPALSDIAFIANKANPVYNASEHDLVMEDITEVATRAVQGHIVFAKSVVAPAVAALAESVADSLNQITPQSLLGMEVQVFTPAAILSNNAFETSVRKYEEVPFDEPRLALRLAPHTVSEILDLMKSGSSSVDADIAEWAASKGDSFFINLWESYFQKSSQPVASFTELLSDKENGVDNALMIHLVTRRIFDNPPKDTEMSLRDFEDTAVQYRNQSGARLCRAIDELNSFDKTGRLVKTIAGYVTTVNAGVYKKWLNDGGENETLFGNIISGKPCFTVDLINEKADELKSLWVKHAALTAVVEGNRRFNTTKQLLLANFVAQMRDMDEHEDCTESNREIIIGKFKDLLADVSEKEMHDLYSLSLKLVCRSRFYTTDAERILSGIERIKCENPEISVREAAAISMIEYVAYWLSTQFRVVSVS